MHHSNSRYLPVVFLGNNSACQLEAVHLVIEDQFKMPAYCQLPNFCCQFWGKNPPSTIVFFYLKSSKYINPKTTVAVNGSEGNVVQQLQHLSHSLNACISNRHKLSTVWCFWYFRLNIHLQKLQIYENNNYIYSFSLQTTHLYALITHFIDNNIKHSSR